MKEQKSKLSFKPMQDYLILEQVEEKERSEGGIWLPETARTPLNQGAILDQGPDTDRELYPVGAVVVFTMHTEYRVRFDRDTYIVVRAADVILVEPPKTQTAE